MELKKIQELAKDKADATKKRVKTLVKRLDPSNAPNYEYPATRARTMASRLLKDEDYSKFLKMDINEIIRFLEERDYKEEVDAIGAKASKMPYLEQILNENLSKSIRKLVLFTPKNSPLQDFLMRYDITNIKTILRAMETKRPAAETKAGLVVAGWLGKEFWEKMLGKENRQDIILGLRGTPYYSVIKKHANGKLEEMEDALDKFYFKTVLESADVCRQLKELTQAEIDIKNILIIMRLKGAKNVDIEKFLLNGGTIKLKKIISLSKLEAQEMMTRLKKEKFWKYAPATAEELERIEAGARKYIVLGGTDLVKRIDAGLRKYLVLAGPEMLKSYLPSFDTLLGYIISKEREISNIRIIARSKMTKSPEDAMNIRAKMYMR